MSTDKNFQLTTEDLVWLASQYSTEQATPPPTETPLSTLLGARLLGPVLDRQLSAGISPETNSLLSARARLLATTTMRSKIVRGYEKLLAPPRGSGLLHAVHSPVPWSRITHFEAQIRTMLDRLCSPLCATRGVAMANSLLCDGAGPLYSLASNIPLGVALAEATTLLDTAVQ